MGRSSRPPHRRWTSVFALATGLTFCLPLFAQEAREQPAVDWSEEQILAATSQVRAGRKLTPSSWPNGARMAVCLSFDVDNETLSLVRGATAPVTLSAGEFGALSGLTRVLALLERHHVPASFYIPAVSVMLHPEMIEQISKPGRHEIGVHGWVHENLPSLDDRERENELLDKAMDYLARATGKPPVGFRAPSWAFSEHTLDLIREAGFLYDSSMMAMDEPYELLSHGEATGMVELPVDWILDDYPYFGPNASGSMPSAETVAQTYRDEFDVAYQEGTMLMLTFHPHIIGHRARMKHLDELMYYMKSKPGVWFATAEAIATYVREEAGLE